MIQDRICKQCGITFKGGPRAYYCPSCRLERRRKTDREHKQKSRKGLVRKLGSLATCERCQGKYVVKGGLQRYCEECQEAHAKEHDRETSLEFYHIHKDRINHVRNIKRRKSYQDNKQSPQP